MKEEQLRLSERNYLTTQVQTGAIDLDDASFQTAQRELAKACLPRSKEEKAKLLNDWCEQYLTSKCWQKLKAAIRKRRERRKGGTRVVTISARALEQLQKLSKRDQLTHSETLEKYLAKAVRRR